MTFTQDITAELIHILVGPGITFTEITVQMYSEKSPQIGPKPLPLLAASMA